MIINEECYQDVKDSLDDLKAKTANLETISGSVQHEIDIRVRDIEFYDSVVSGQHPLPALSRFKDYALSLPLRRIRKGLSAKAIADRARIPASDDILEKEIIAFELTDYLPATFGYAACIAGAIEETPDQAQAAQCDIVSETSEESLREYLNSLSQAVEKQVIEENWLLPYLAPEISLSAWKSKCKKLIADNTELSIDSSRFFDDFGEALNMWRVGKKWSYKQLADAVGIEWFVLWHFEKTNYHNALIGTMLAIAEAVQKAHEPSEFSFEPKFRA